MNRRDFLKRAAAGAAGMAFCPSAALRAKPVNYYQEQFKRIVEQMKRSERAFIHFGSSMALA